MRKLLLPVIISIPVTIILLIIAMATSEIWLWDSFAMPLFFPYTVIARSAYKIGEPLPPVINHTLFLQLPLYGIALGIAWLKARLKPVLILLLLLHAMAAGLAIKLEHNSRGTFGVCCSENRK